VLGLAAAAVALWAGGVSATVLVTVDEALRLAFPDASTTRETLFLTEEQLGKVQEDSGAEPRSAMVTRFVADKEGRTVGYAYLDTHRVRTLPETLMVVLEPGGAVRRVEVVTFREPLEYIPNRRWYDQFEGARLSEDLALKRGIRSVTGATLTARATADAVRRVLATHAAAHREGRP
jgi:Na+-translocating ferredoxin:NAD+ oxidoreductase RnfG subunit